VSNLFFDVQEQDLHRMRSLACPVLT